MEVFTKFLELAEQAKEHQLIYLADFKVSKPLNNVVGAEFFTWE